MAGTLPLELSSVPLEHFRFERTSLCENRHSVFQDWIMRIPKTSRAACEAQPDGLKPGFVSVEASYPNPASERARIRYSLPWPASVQLSVFDMAGRQVLHESTLRPTGWHFFDLNLTNVAPGLYLYRVTIRGKSYDGKMIVIN